MATNYVASHQRLLNGQELTYGKTSFSFPIIRFQLCHSSNVFTTHTAGSHIQNSIMQRIGKRCSLPKVTGYGPKKITHVLNKFYLKVIPRWRECILFGGLLLSASRLSYQGWLGSRRNYPSGGRARDLQWQLWVIKHFLNVFWCSWSLSLVINYGVVRCRFEISKRFCSIFIICNWSVW